VGRLVEYTAKILEDEPTGWLQGMRDALAELYGEAEASSETTES
jgi:hypothetical protein